MKQRGVDIVLSIVGGLVLLSILISALNEGSAARVDIVTSGAAQTALTWLIFGVFVILLYLYKVGFGLSLSLYLLLGAFLVAAVAALPLFPAWLRRPVNLYDVGLAVVLCVAFYLVARQIERRAGRPSTISRSVDAILTPMHPLSRPSLSHSERPVVVPRPPARSSPVSKLPVLRPPADLPPASRPPASRPPAPRPPARRKPVRAPSPRSPDYEERYRLFVHKVGGDRRIVDRLIEYERKRKPDASEDQLLDTAIWRYEYDHSR